MGRRNYLIAGVSGAGKTTVATGLEQRGHHVIHGDRVLAYRGDPATGAPLNCPAGLSEVAAVDWLNSHWIWPVDRVHALIADHSHPVTFFCGGSRNQRHFAYLFDAVFVLDVDFHTLNQRLATRPKDEFGGRAVERALIGRLHATREDAPQNGICIDATRPPAAVVDDILLRCRMTS
jgi:gluconate kinase